MLQKPINTKEDEFDIVRENNKQRLNAALFNVSNVLNRHVDEKDKFYLKLEETDFVFTEAEVDNFLRPAVDALQLLMDRYDLTTEELKSHYKSQHDEE